MADSYPPAAFLIGHGTRSATGLSQLRQFAEQVSAQRRDIPVGLGIIEHAEPDLDDGIDMLLGSDPLIASGSRQLVAVPLVLLGAGHLKDDGPQALARARRRHPHLDAAYAPALGVHPAVLDVAADRACEAGGAETDAVVLVGRGSSDPDANADLHKVARLLADGRGLGMGAGGATADQPSPSLGLVEPAFVSLAEPGVAGALGRCHRLGARSITVQPYFLFRGVLMDRIASEALEWEREHAGCRVLIGRELSPDPRLHALVWHRYDQARSGTATMNCDCCVYRAGIHGGSGVAYAGPAIGIGARRLGGASA